MQVTGIAEDRSGPMRDIGRVIARAGTPSEPHPLEAMVGAPQIWIADGL